MQEEKYYKTIVNLIEEHEVNKKVRELKDNSDTLNLYWTIGKEIVEAQGGSTRAKYGDELIRKWSIKLKQIYGSGYNTSNLKRFRLIYLYFQKGATVSTKLSWSHIQEILPLKS